MTPWILTVPLAALLLLFFVVFASLGAGLILGAAGYLVRAVMNRDYGSILGVITLGSVVALFGWVIMIGSYDAGSTIIDGLITRLSQ